MNQRIQLFLLSLVTFFFLIGCQGDGPKDDGKVSFIFLQMNDVYEIAPISGGKVGGLARVATVRKELLKETPNVYTILAGDFLNPSVIGTMRHNGQKIAGAHMVDAMNAMGVDLVTFGNHEFDLNDEALVQRINESEFDWVSSNISHITDQGLEPFMKTRDGKTVPIPKTYIFNAKNAGGTEIRIGLLGVTLDANKCAFVTYEDPTAAAVAAYVELMDTAEVVLALTHLTLEEDLDLAPAIPKVKLLMGGHEHEHMYKTAESGNIVAKADANAKTVYIHRFTYDTKTQDLTLESELRMINDSIPSDPATAAVVAKWADIADKSFAGQGFDPNHVVTTVSEDDPWDGRESSIRNKPTNLGQSIAMGMLHAAPKADCAVFNSGSIRVDDMLMGDITEYDVIRTLPFGGDIPEVDMKGSTLRHFLNTGIKNKGSGGFLQWGNIQWVNQKDWMVNGEDLDDTKTYRVVTTDFLLTGGEANLDWLVPSNPEILNVYEPEKLDQKDPRHDIRRAWIGYLEKK